MPLTVGDGLILFCIAQLFLVIKKVSKIDGFLTILKRMCPIIKDTEAPK